MSNRLIIAVDFGTTYSGLAYADAQDDRQDAKVQLFTDWPGKQGGANFDKAPSRISYGKPPGNEIHWGYGIKPRANGAAPVHALMKLNLDASLKHSKQLKLLLALMGTPAETFGIDDLRLDAEHQDPEDAPPDYPGKTMVDIIADYLTEVRKAAFKRMIEQYTESLFNTLRKELVVTVPAVWSERAKDLTLKAVEQAGFKSDIITLAPEPEAAAVYTLRNMTTGVFAKAVDVGDIFVVCDAGGGTVDLISYKICSPGPEFKLEEAVIGTGDKCGSSYIDKEFVSWLEKWLGTTAFDRIPKEILLHGSKFLNDFELLKYDFTGEEEDIEIRLPRECGIRDDKKKNIDYNTLTITNEQFKSFFDPCVIRVMELVDEQVAAVLETHKKLPKMVILVGGFGRSAYLFNHLDEYCQQRNILAIRPQDPWSAVVRGAVMRGLERSSDGFISVRLARRHYGTFVSKLFVEGVHLEEDAYYDRFSGKKRARGQMEWLLEKGSRLPETTPKSFKIDLSYEFALDEDKSFTSVLVSSDSDTAPTRYADDSTRNVGRIGTDLRDVPVHLFCRCRHRPDGPECYQASFQVEATFSNNRILWRSLFGGKEYGKVTLEYER